MEKKKIAIIGIGRVGLPFALYLDALGFDVVGIDRDQAMVEKVNQRKMPFIEPGCDELLTQSKMTCTTSYDAVSKVDYIILTVGTPLMSHIETDLSNIEHVLEIIHPLLRPHQCFILRSTVAPKTTDYVKKFIEKYTKLKVGINFGLTFCPERLAEHKALAELKTLPQIIGCEDNMSYEMAEKIFSTFGVKIFRTTFISAELTKLFNNTSRYIDFAVANQFAIIANNFGQNIYEILRLSNEDYPRGYIYSPGFTAGTCLRKDFGMINELSPGPDLLLAAWKVNEFMPYHLVELASRHVNLNTAKIAVLGYTFKSNSDDLRDSLVPKLLRYLERLVPKEVSIVEPNIQAQSIDGYPNLSLEEALKDADAVFIATNHDEFKTKKVWDLLKKGCVLIDLWNCLGENKVTLIK
ncbi:MAG: hypothetical protein A3G32_04335 [Deltaproteobacteria bacterium RIFCSPLOWO2_12_FULL_40_28]|nr:MAG: hypothetical protein A3C45_08445 [Deltaproteobacteria bacterium RIFCSPHIGHO2_02_FULL_40_28]OGQ19599.1 MAG: hypothetical protein A3E27_07640 [Deltaproteobacteria bacterium RIFCSPHIGHO2_12_FULL_40_32]OGQ40876.1 MAG: hypothetical protein A3I69_03055 [Deltaproteobacteria bacterium RIFCSPLOWO2_02_FULL_40_36]OGQ53991.1 MAG: hypothetical protein A3G32_04335 [Deltaproteobacteria bacterium RIFCSPLOWO2_12_FULL_40_28]